jgi:hypothetical protein
MLPLQGKDKHDDTFYTRYSSVLVLKELNRIAQGNALGIDPVHTSSPEGAQGACGIVAVPP